MRPVSALCVSGQLLVAGCEHGPQGVRLLVLPEAVSVGGLSSAGDASAAAAALPALPPVVPPPGTAMQQQAAMLQALDNHPAGPNGTQRALLVLTHDPLHTVAALTFCPRTGRLITVGDEELEVWGPAE